MSERVSDTISLVMPLRNGERFVAQALDSVMAQTRPPDEILVVEGGSTDRSREVASSYDAVTLVDQQGDGIANAWNEGIQQSTGSLIAFLDSDDLWAPQKLEIQLAALEGRHDAAGILGVVHHFQEPGYELQPNMRPELIGSSQIAQMPSVMLVRRETFDRVGLFDEELQIAADIDWYARFKDMGLTWIELDELVLEKRYHDTNLSVTAARQNNAEMTRLLRRSIERQRGRE